MPLATLGLLPRSQITIFPFTKLGSSELSMHSEAGSIPDLPGETPESFLPLPRTITAGKFLSMVPAPTEVIHGATLVTDIPLGPSFPAEDDTKTPLEAAP
ncbi:hypothetical protein F8388_014209 [Cannabis sativa]|uniref:Uncharacterized protein n=1 Tax=Cannabis sativa TaxID=3483 RepID=A0A7J6GNM9_CANSA|nr:hypothetical protein F8388_014209 [Cannabis sativa]